MSLSRAQAATAATLAALGGLTAAALSAGATPHHAAWAAPTAIVTHRTVHVHRTIRTTRTIVESQAGKILSDHTVTKRSKAH